MAAGTDQATEIQAPAPELLERGRYVLWGMPDGSWRIVRAGPLCETCQECGCGEQQDPIDVPAMVVNIVTGKGQLPGPLQAMLGKVIGHGR